MTRTAMFCLVLGALAACKSKTKSDRAMTQGSGSAPAIAPADAPAAVANTVKVPAGTASFGCIGWNAAAKSAACITGEIAAGEESRYEIDYLNGSESPTKLVVKDRDFDDTTAANATLAKLGMVAFPSPAKTIKGPVPGDSDLGGGAKLVWADKIMDEGGDNQAPTTAHDVVMTCANKQEVELDKTEQEGLEIEFHVWSVPDHVVIEKATHIGREGEARSMRKVWLIELATCKVVDDAG